MKVVILSDLHLGDKACALTQNNNQLVRKLVESFGKSCDYLVFAGDLLDIAVASYQEVFTVTRAFFQELKAQGLEVKRSIVYSPGNHDFDIWDTFQRQHNIIEQIGESSHKLRAFQWSIPGLFDEARDQFLLPGAPGDPELYDIEFLHKIMGFRVALAYPNLYYLHRDNTVDLITHGHYFDEVWSYLGNAASAIHNPVMELRHPDNLSIHELVQFNFPFNQLTCTGVGQSGKMTKYMHYLQTEYNAGRMSGIYADLKLLVKFVLSARKKWWQKVFFPIATPIAYHAIKSGLAISRLPETPSDYLHEEKAQINRYVESSRREMRELKDIPDGNIQRVIFGHTHSPIPVEKPVQLELSQGLTPFSNMGGWLQGCAGAQIHIYESGKALRSIPFSFQ